MAKPFPDNDLKRLKEMLDPKDNRILVGWQVDEWRALLARLEAAEDAVNAERCPHCPDQGFWVRPNEHTGDPEQVQCEWCATNLNSRFQKEIIWRKAAGK